MMTPAEAQAIVMQARKAGFFPTIRAGRRPRKPRTTLTTEQLRQRKERAEQALAHGLRTEDVKKEERRVYNLSFSRLRRESILRGPGLARHNFPPGLSGRHQWIKALREAQRQRLEVLGCSNVVRVHRFNYPDGPEGDRQYCHDYQSEYRMLKRTERDREGANL